MQTRIEVTIDCDLPQELIEPFRKICEDSAWVGVDLFRKTQNHPLHPVMVQANERPE